MKKIILFSLMSLFCVEVFAQVRFFEGTWEEALAKAKQENKVLMVDFYTTWCGPCKLMTKTTFADTNLGDFVNQNFIAYKIDCEKGEGFQLAEKYEIEGY
ncbi:MAG: thioredoxin family protein, partial [Thermonemataceae bacterium]|nr:thioredoxin family protein [Thermonemataceae bacterium]